MSAAAEAVLLDQHEMARGLPYLGLTGLTVSDDGNLLAYGTDTTGFRQFDLHVKDLGTGRTLPDTAARVTSMEWAADNRTLFLTTEDRETKRSNQLWRLALSGKPELVYEEKDELYILSLARTRDRKYLLLDIHSTDTWETRVLDALTPAGEFKAVLPREKGHKYEVEHRNGLFYLRTNKDAKNFRVVTAPVPDPGPGGWKEFLPHKADTLIEAVDLFKDFAVAREKSQALTRFRILSFKTGSWREVDFPEPVYSAFAGGTPEFDTRLFRIHYQSMITPSSCTMPAW